MSATQSESVPHQQVDLGGLETGFIRRGSGPPLVLLTGQGYTGKWLPLYDRLAEQFDLVVPDHPGFGSTDVPDFITDFNDLVVHLAELFDELGLGRVHLVGHGFGGWLAAEFAGVYPERLQSLTLIAPAGLRPDENEPMVDWYRMRRDQVLDLTLGEDRKEWEELVAADPDFAVSTVTEYKERIGIARVAWNPRYSFRLERRLRRVTVPSQIIVPDQDDLIAPSIARRYSELLPNVTLTKVSGASSSPTRHLVVLQEPDQIAELIAALANSSKEDQ